MTELIDDDAGQHPVEESSAAEPESNDDPADFPLFAPVNVCIEGKWQTRKRACFWRVRGKTCPQGKDCPHSHDDADIKAFKDLMSRDPKARRVEKASRGPLRAQDQRQSQRGLGQGQGGGRWRASHIGQLRCSNSS